MFETNLRDERFLPFEGAGAISTWSLSLPDQLRPFDYATIADVILHIRYTAREAGNPLAAAATTELVAMLDAAGQSGQALLLCLRYDFPTPWSAFVAGDADFTATVTKQFFPYAVQGARKLTVDTITLYASGPGTDTVALLTPTVDLAALSIGLNSTTGEYTLDLPADAKMMIREPSRLVFLVLGYHFGVS